MTPAVVGTDQVGLPCHAETPPKSEPVNAGGTDFSNYHSIVILHLVIWFMGSYDLCKIENKNRGQVVSGFLRMVFWSGFRPRDEPPVPDSQTHGNPFLPVRFSLPRTLVQKPIRLKSRCRVRRDKGISLFLQCRRLDHGIGVIPFPRKHTKHS